MSASDQSQPHIGHAATAETPTDRTATGWERRLVETDRRTAAVFQWSRHRDRLTGALQRDPGRHQLQGVITRARLSCAPLSVVSFGVDYLKAVNEREGHDRGDLLLAAAGRALHLSLRRDDVIVRHDGHKFVCALPAIDDAQTVAAIGRVGRTMRGLIAGGMVSAGYAQLIAGDSLDDLIDRADADRQGRRRRRRVPGTPSSTYAASIGCAACGERISLREFVIDGSSRPTRTADCPGCGEVTLITLA